MVLAFSIFMTGTPLSTDPNVVLESDYSTFLDDIAQELHSMYGQRSGERELLEEPVGGLIDWGRKELSNAGKLFDFRRYVEAKSRPNLGRVPRPLLWGWYAALRTERGTLTDHLISLGKQHKRGKSLSLGEVLEVAVGLEDPFDRDALLILGHEFGYVRMPTNMPKSAQRDFVGLVVSNMEIVYGLASSHGTDQSQIVGPRAVCDDVLRRLYRAVHTPETVAEAYLAPTLFGDKTIEKILAGEEEISGNRDIQLTRHNSLVSVDSASVYSHLARISALMQMSPRTFGHDDMLAKSITHLDRLENGDGTRDLLEFVERYIADGRYENALEILKHVHDDTLVPEVFDVQAACAREAYGKDREDDAVTFEDKAEAVRYNIMIGGFRERIAADRDDDDAHYQRVNAILHRTGGNFRNGLRDEAIASVQALDRLGRGRSIVTIVQAYQRSGFDKAALFCLETLVNNDSTTALAWKMLADIRREDLPYDLTGQLAKEVAFLDMKYNQLHYSDCAEQARQYIARNERAFEAYVTLLDASFRQRGMKEPNNYDEVHDALEHLEISGQAERVVGLANEYYLISQGQHTGEQYKMLTDAQKALYLDVAKALLIPLYQMRTSCIQVYDVLENVSLAAGDHAFADIVREDHWNVLQQNFAEGPKR
jgi:hypothetical protein